MSQRTRPEPRRAVPAQAEGHVQARGAARDRTPGCINSVWFDGVEARNPGAPANPACPAWVAAVGEARRADAPATGAPGDAAGAEVHGNDAIDGTTAARAAVVPSSPESTAAVVSPILA